MFQITLNSWTLNLRQVRVVLAFHCLQYCPLYPVHVTRQTILLDNFDTLSKKAMIFELHMDLYRHTGLKQCSEVSLISTDVYWCCNLHVYEYIQHYWPPVLVLLLVHLFPVCQAHLLDQVVLAYQVNRVCRYHPIIHTCNYRGMQTIVMHDTEI